MRIPIARLILVLITIACLTGCQGRSRYNPFARSDRDVVEDTGPVRPSESASPEVSLPGASVYADSGSRSSSGPDETLSPQRGSYSNASYRDSVGLAANTSPSADGYDRPGNQGPSSASPSPSFRDVPRSDYGGMASRERFDRSATPAGTPLYSGLGGSRPGATTNNSLYQGAGSSAYVGSSPTSRNSLGSYGQETGGYGQPYTSTAAGSTGLTSRPPAPSGGSIQRNPAFGGSTTADAPLYGGASSFAGLDRSAPDYNLPQNSPIAGQPTSGSDVPSWSRNATTPPASQDNTLASRPLYTSPGSSAGPSATSGSYAPGVYSSTASSGAEACSGEDGCCPLPAGNTNTLGGSTSMASYSSPPAPYTPGSIRAPSSSSAFPYGDQSSGYIPQQSAAPSRGSYLR